MHSIVIDLGFGDAGKGTIVDALARWNPNTSAVVRFNGGAQAAHNVVTDDGVHHTFAQYGSASLTGVPTFLGPEFMLNPINLFNESEALDQLIPRPWERLSIHPDALVITPYHQRLNQKTAAHGTTGQGIGETMKDSLRQDDSQVLRARDLLDRKTFIEKFIRVKSRKIQEARKLRVPLLTPGGDDNPDMEFIDRCLWLADNGCVRNNLQELADQGDLIFEGAQGVLLDQDHGFHPHTTWSRTTHHNALQLLSSLRNGADRQMIGVLRTYQTRHGAGPFVTEHVGLVTEPHNTSDGWAGQFRTGHLDFVALRYALEVCPVDSLAVTHMDKVGDTIPVCDSYRYRGTMPDLDPYFYRDGDDVKLIHRSPDPESSHAHMEAITNRLSDMGSVLTVVAREKLIGTIEEKLGRPVTIVSSSPSFSGKKMETLDATKEVLA